MKYKLGLKPAVHTLESMRKAAVLSQHLDQLGPAPTSSDDYSAAVLKQISNGDWGMDGNDEVGDCTCADASHQHMLWTANTGTIEVPSAQQTIDLYSAITGYTPTDPNTDQGAMIAQVCRYIETTGYMGNKLAGFADVMPLNIDHVRWGIQLFGSVKLGINLPASADDQFDQDGAWKYIGDTNIVGGHDVCCVGYIRNVWYIVTWGKLITMGPAFFNHYVTEVKAPLALNWCRQGNTAPNKLNLQQLQAELSWEGTVG